MATILVGDGARLARALHRSHLGRSDHDIFFPEGGAAASDRAHAAPVTVTLLPLGRTALDPCRALGLGQELRTMPVTSVADAPRRDPAIAAVEVRA